MIMWCVMCYHHVMWYYVMCYDLTRRCTTLTSGGATSCRACGRRCGAGTWRCSTGSCSPCTRGSPSSKLRYPFHRVTTRDHCRALRTVMVMLVSSVWHGVHPGYYLSLGSVPFCLMVSSKRENDVICKPNGCNAVMHWKACLSQKTKQRSHNLSENP